MRNLVLIGAAGLVLLYLVRRQQQQPAAAPLIPPLPADPFGPLPTFPLPGGVPPFVPGVVD